MRGCCSSIAIIELISPGSSLSIALELCLKLRSRCSILFVVT